MVAVRIPLLLCLLGGIVAEAQAQFNFRQSGGGWGGVREESRILTRYDSDKDGVLNARERQAALADFGFDTRAVSNKPAAIPPERRLTPAQVKSFSNEALYDPYTLRTIFLTFDTHTWEDELAVFKGSDVKVPAIMVVDGKTYRDVGVSFRGQTSFRMVGSGQKRSMNLDIDFRHKDQQLLGNIKITLLNSAGDASFLRSVMYMHIARQYYLAPRANFMRVVINGENWGTYVNQQPPDSVFALANGGSTGPLWKTPGTPRGRAGLEYWGDDASNYQQVYELVKRGKGTQAEAWKSLVTLCRVLNQTPLDKLTAALAPIMDVDQALRFLAVDNVLMNSDGYWTRASDYVLYIDNGGRFRFAAYDVNETMRPEEGFGGWRRRNQVRTEGGGAGELRLHPLAGADDPAKALLHRLLQVPELKQRYLGYVRDIADKWLHWERFGGVALKYQAVIYDEVRRDTHKLYSGDAFINALAVDLPSNGGMMGPSGLSLKSFADGRRAYLLGLLGSR
jgi:spore coat protein CotH